MIRLSLVLASMFFLVCNTFATPLFKGLNNKHGKTSITIEIPSSDRDASNGISIDNIKLYNNGEILNAKKVKEINKKKDVQNDNLTMILEFRKLTTFADCKLSFTLNDEPVMMNIQEILLNR